MQYDQFPQKRSNLGLSFVAFMISVLLGVGSLAFIFSKAGFESLVQGLLVLGGFWVYAIWRRWMWVSAVGILLLVASAGFGLWNELSPGWMIAGTLGGLLSWDLTEFIRRMDVAPNQTDLLGMERRHVARLTLVATVGLVLASIAIFVRLDFTLEWLMLLAFVAVLGVTQLGAWLRSGGG